MHFSSIIAIATFAMTAAAAPNPVLEVRTGGSCTASNERPICCSTFLGIPLCFINIGGGNCDGSSHCCETTQNSGFINIALLNCFDL